MIDDAKLDELLALAEATPMFYSQTGLPVPLIIEHETFRALVQEVKAGRASAWKSYSESIPMPPLRELRLDTYE